MLKTDNEAAAEQPSNEFSDKRLTYFWDGKRQAGKLWQRVLGTPGAAWDVYLLYRAAADWKNEPRTPDFWMISPAAEAGGKVPPLDESTFEAKANEMLSEIK